MYTSDIRTFQAKREVCSLVHTQPQSLHFQSSYYTSFDSDFPHKPKFLHLHLFESAHTCTDKAEQFNFKVNALTRRIHCYCTLSQVGTLDKESQNAHRFKSFSLLLCNKFHFTLSQVCALFLNSQNSHRCKALFTFTLQQF